MSINQPLEPLPASLPAVTTESAVPGNHCIRDRAVSPPPHDDNQSAQRRPPLGRVAYQVGADSPPGTCKNKSRLAHREINLENSAVIEQGKVFFIELGKL